MDKEVLVIFEKEDDELMGWFSDKIEVSTELCVGMLITIVEKFVSEVEDSKQLDFENEIKEGFNRILSDRWEILEDLD